MRAAGAEVGDAFDRLEVAAVALLAGIEGGQPMFASLHQPETRQPMHVEHLFELMQPERWGLPSIRLGGLFFDSSGVLSLYGYESRLEVRARECAKELETQSGTREADHAQQAERSRLTHRASCATSSGSACSRPYFSGL